MELEAAEELTPTPCAKVSKYYANMLLSILLPTPHLSWEEPPNSQNH